MATPVPAPSPAPPPPPAPPPEPLVSRAAKDIANAKTGPDATRPLRYGFTFIKGMVVDGLDGMAKWGRKGFMIGLGLGVIAGIAAPVSIGLVAGIMGGLLGGLGIGALGGGALGLATGGPKALGRLHRSEVYAEDLIVRKKIQDNAPPNRNNYRNAYADQRLRQQRFDRQVIERNNEEMRDFRRYDTPWTERENHRRHQAEQQQQQGQGY